MKGGGSTDTHSPEKTTLKMPSLIRVKYRDSNSCYRLPLLLSGDNSINTGSFHKPHQLDHDKWNDFKH